MSAGVDYTTKQEANYTTDGPPCKNCGRGDPIRDLDNGLEHVACVCDTENDTADAWNVGDRR